MEILIAVDIDGTLTAWPQTLYELMKAFGNENGSRARIVFLTGCSCERPESAPYEAMLANRIAQIRSYGHFFDGLACTSERDVVICVGRNGAEVAEKKAVYCRDHGVKIFIDNDPGYCQAVRRLSPTTLVLWVHP